MARNETNIPRTSPIRIVTALTLDQAVTILSIAAERPQAERSASA